MTLTIRDLKEMIKDYDDDIEVYFGGLDFYRLKMRDKKLVQVEFSQTVSKNRSTGEVTIDNIY
jgi:hypothetical protein